MLEANIKSAWHAAGLVPFNRRKVLVRMPGFVEVDCNSEFEEIHQELLPPPVQPLTVSTRNTIEDRPCNPPGSKQGINFKYRCR